MAFRILIVDDSPRFRALAAELLTAHGFELLEQVADAEQALAVVAEACPDGILLDINLSRSNGFAVAPLLAAACPGARIVLASASIHDVPAEIVESCAAVAFVPKHELAVADLQALFAA